MLPDLMAAAAKAEAAGAWPEALAQYELAFSRLPREGDAGTAARLLRFIGRLHWRQGNVELAAEAFEASLAVAEAAGLTEDLAYVLNSLGGVEQFAGKTAEAEALYRRARDLAERCGAVTLTAMVEQNLGALETIRGNVDTALLHYCAAAERYRRVGDFASVVGVLNNMGMAYVDRGDWELADACYRDALVLLRSNPDADALARVELNRAELLGKRGQYAPARQGCDRAMVIFSRLESKRGLAEAYKLHGLLHRATGKAHLAEVHLGLALELAQLSEDRLLEAETQMEWALVHLQMGRHREALLCLNRSHKLFTNLQAGRELKVVERRLADLGQPYETVVAAWATETIESKDPYTAGHSERVADLSSRIADSIGLGGWDRRWLRLGAFLHDVGKTALPSTMLTKVEALTQAEWRLIQTHTVVGSQIVGELGFPSELQQLVRSHHERWDGTGYPDRLRGEEIPVSARILSLADVYDAMTSRRVYRAPLSHRTAMREIGGMAGSAFDPDLVPVFRGVVEEALDPGHRGPAGAFPAEHNGTLALAATA